MRPSKSYFYKTLYRDIFQKLEPNRNLQFIDFACGHGQLLHDFKFKKYIGIDIDKNEILSLKLKFPNQTFYNEDILFFKSSVRGDLACCVETFGFNTKFDKKKLINTLKNISNNLNTNGSFFLNIHYDLFETYKEDINFLFKKFKKVKIKRYGYFTKRRSKLIHKILFQLEKALSKIFNSGKYLYVKCEDYSSDFSTK